MDTIMIEDLSGKNLFVGLALVLLLFSYEPMEQDIKEYYAVAKRMIKNHMTGTLGLVLNAFQNLLSVTFTGMRFQVWWEGVYILPTAG